jgi:hypothetical protein
MKLLFTVCLLMGIGWYAGAQTIYSQSFKNIDGQTVTLSSFQHKKLLLFIAPIERSDSLRINEIDSFQTVYGDSVQLIGIMSIEDGYTDSLLQEIKAYYTGSNIILTEGMYTRKAAATSQHALLQWLTTRSLNKRTDDDIIGTGQKFFISSNGRLQEVQGPAVPFFNIRLVALIQ